MALPELECNEKWNAINPARNENKLRVITNNSGPRKVALENCRIWNGTLTKGILQRYITKQRII